ncbi:MAG: hypothetical protein FP825_05105 [Hyphomonas sp.]|nr:hypothetical protein [Hyphomonas sp.]MBU4165990.1 hypothetical protein [Alphaproteobacteria bacterium]
MRRSMLVLSVFFGLGACSPPPADGEGVSPAPFAEEIHVFAMEDEIFPPAPCATLFVGSSSIRFWFRLTNDFPEAYVIRRGFGGAAISDINHYFDEVVSRYHPSRIVFYAGENDLNAGMAVEDAVSAFHKFMDMKDSALGATPVYFISVKPSVARVEELPLQAALNQEMAALAETRADLTFIDVAGPMMKDGMVDREVYVSDQLHMNARGYDIWRDVIHRALESESETVSPFCP